MNRIINAYGATLHDGPVGSAVNTLVDNIAAGIQAIVNEYALTPEEIIILAHKATQAVDASCAEHVLRKALAMRQAERASCDIIGTLAKIPELRPKLEKLKVETVSAKRDIRTPAQWCDFFGVEVIDPDGWRHGKQPSWDTPITRDMFKERYFMSTVRVKDPAKYKVWRHYFEGNA